MSYGYAWKPYVSVAERRKKAEREMARLRKTGYDAAPVVLQGRKLASSFWGKAWGDNLESYSDYANRLPRGRTYVRNGSVVDLQVNRGEVKAMVMGSELYEVRVTVAPLPKARWTAICNDCSGSIDSLVELLQGRLSKAVMERVCQQKTGLFPAPAEIELSCSCPDWASMCKHLAAVLYGIGARLDEQPALMFALRGVDESELVARAVKGRTLQTKAPASAKVLQSDDISALFGLEIQSATRPVPKAKTAAKGLKQAPDTPAKKSRTKPLVPTAKSKATASRARATGSGKRKAPVD